MHNTFATFRTIVAVACLAGLAAAGGCAKHEVSTRSSGADQVAQGGTVLVPAGAAFYGQLQAPINTKTAHDGDTFVLVQTDRAFHQGPAALTGSSIDGHLDGITPAGPMRNPKLTLVFDDIRMSDGTKMPVNVALHSFYLFEPKSHHLRTIGMMIGGGIAAHKMAHKGLLGAVGGYAVSQQLKTDIVVPQNAVVQLTFKAPVTSGQSAPASPASGT